jgi:UDP-4-amino-4,6-dideoxy-N-acetyl-beta-L-altrosamine N-acetyltransferase
MDGEPVGLANFYDIDLRNLRGAWAYYLAEPSVRGRGIGAYVEMLMIERAFGEFGLEKLWCEVLESNKGVVRMHQRFGFKEEARFRRHILKHGAWEDVIGLGLLAGEWPEPRARMAETLKAAGFPVSVD